MHMHSYDCVNFHRVKYSQLITLLQLQSHVISCMHCNQNVYNFSHVCDWNSLLDSMNYCTERLCETSFSLRLAYFQETKLQVFFMIMAGQILCQLGNTFFAVIMQLAIWLIMIDISLDVASNNTCYCFQILVLPYYIATHSSPSNFATWKFLTEVNKIHEHI